jgi:hypothetical protein
VVWHQNHSDDFSRFGLKTGGTIFSDLTLKPMTTVSPGLPLKSVAQVFQFGPQNQQLWFGDLSLKIIATVSWFGP